MSEKWDIDRLVNLYNFFLDKPISVELLEEFYKENGDEDILQIQDYVSENKKEIVKDVFAINIIEAVEILYKNRE